MKFLNVKSVLVGTTVLSAVVISVVIAMHWATVTFSRTQAVLGAFEATAMMLGRAGAEAFVEEIQTGKIIKNARQREKTVSLLKQEISYAFSENTDKQYDEFRALVLRHHRLLEIKNSYNGSFLEQNSGDEGAAKGNSVELPKLSNFEYYISNSRFGIRRLRASEVENRFSFDETVKFLKLTALESRFEMSANVLLSRYFDGPLGGIKKTLVTLGPLFRSRMDSIRSLPQAQYYYRQIFYTSLDGMLASLISKDNNFAAPDLKQKIKVLKWMMMPAQVKGFVFDDVLPAGVLNDVPLFYNYESKIYIKDMPPVLHTFVKDILNLNNVVLSKQNIESLAASIVVFGQTYGIKRWFDKAGRSNFKTPSYDKPIYSY